MKFTTITFLLFLVSSTFVFAHGPIHESIKRVTKKIKKDPKNASLYIERGQYYQIDENFDQAYNDFLTAKSLDPDIKELDYHCGKLFSQNGYPVTAERFTNNFLSYNSKHVGGLMLRASIYVQMGKDSLAIIDYEEAIRNTTTPQPEYFVDISKACIAADSTDFNSALKWLEKGEEYLGFNIVLMSYSYDLAKDVKEFEKAATIVDKVLPKLNRKESWLYKKAVVLEMAKDNENARNIYQETIKQIKNLPVRLQKTKMMLELEANTRMALIRLN